MRNISVAMTKKQIRAQEKDITRRFGWLFLKPGDILQPVEKGMGLKKGESIVKVGCPIRILSTRLEPLNAITQDDVIREGFPDWTPEQFIEMLVKHYRVDPSKEVNRIEFEYVNLQVEEVTMEKCNGKKCNAIDGIGHSEDCKKEHDIHHSDASVEEQVPSCFERAEYRGRVFDNCMYFKDCKQRKPICADNPLSKKGI